MFATRKDGKQYPFVLKQKRPNPCRFGMNERIFSRLCFGGELLQRFGVIPSSEDPTLSAASVLRYITVLMVVCRGLFLLLRPQSGNEKSHRYHIHSQ